MMSNYGVVMENIRPILAVIIFLITYGIIITDKIHRMVTAFAGAGLVLIFGILDQEKALAAIDFNTIGLLIGMMIIVGLTRRTGVFEYLSIKAAKLAQGDPWLLMLSLALLTALSSALLDNVTAVLLIVPVTFSIARELELNPLPYLITQIIASNIGGTATLIGDPPNIMIGSAAGLGFVDFVVNLFVPVTLTFIVTLLLLKRIYQGELVIAESRRLKVMAFEEKEFIRDYLLLKKSLLILGLTILGFIFAPSLHLESATIALSGATLLLLITREEPEDILLAIEWPTIFFFVGLFVLVGGLEHAGVIEWVARKALALTAGALLPATMTVLWLSALASAFVDNIPFAATMIPLIQKMGELGGIANLEPLWWALSLGACLGGNGTLIGASANVIVAGMAEKQGVVITFRQFFRIAFPLMLVSIVISMLYLYFFYLI
jgi:Na+/H+ antiporter NhaD/arsenite permease-like protein